LWNNPSLKVDDFGSFRRPPGVALRPPPSILEWESFATQSKPHLKIDPAWIARDFSSSIRLSLLGPTPAEVEQRGASLLREADAQGWGYVGYSHHDPLSTLFSPKDQEIRVPAGHSGLEEPSRFLLVEDGEYPWRAGTGDLSRRNTIQASGLDSITGEELTQFFRVNNRFLEDLPARVASSAGAPNPYSSFLDSSTLVVTSAKLKSGKEVVTVFSLSDAARTGAQKGAAYVLSREAYPVNPWVPGDTAEARLKQRLAGSPPRRVILYGALPGQIDLPKICESAGHQLILRATQTARNLVQSEARLQALEKQKLDESQITVVDGLPQSAADVRAMGHFAGSADAWLAFRKKIHESLGTRSVRRIAARKEFLHELAEGESNLLVLVAHSTGSDLYLNGVKISIAELRQMPPREKQSANPRLAILVACDAERRQL
jgi:hypothetical protein